MARAGGCRPRRGGQHRLSDRDGTALRFARSVEGARVSSSRAAALPRVLCIMGSGETAPTMVSVHAELISRLGTAHVPAVLLDTPFGFQENADDISARAATYFRENV